MKQTKKKPPSLFAAHLYIEKLVTLTSSNNSDSASIVCPSPLIPNPDPFAVNQPAGCIGSCCLACPIINNFYDETAFQTFNYWSQGIRFVSFFMATLLLLSYAFLPNKRNHPNAILFFFFIALWLFFLPNVLGWRGRKANQCFDSVTPSSQFNNKMCLAQGFILIFSTHSVVMWIFCLALNLHLAAVWKSTFLSTRYYM